MTTDQAIEIFWKAYEDYPKRVIGGRERIRQPDLYKHAMEAVLEACEKEWVERYLSMTESVKTISWQLKNGYLSPEPLRTETG